MEPYDPNSELRNQFSHIPVLNTLPSEPEEEFLDATLMDACADRHTPGQLIPEQTTMAQSKRENNSLEPIHSKKPRIRENQGMHSQRLLVRVLIDTKNAGGLIGRGGATVKSMRTESKANIEIGHLVQGARKRIVTVSGNTDKIAHALHLISNKIAENKKEGMRINHGETDASPEGELISITLLIPNGQVGGIIGKAGARISVTRKDTECSIHISATCLDNSSEKVVTIKGTSDQVYKALAVICSQLMENVHKTAISPYVPAPELIMNNFLFERPIQGGLMPGRSMGERSMGERSMGERSMGERSIPRRLMTNRSMSDRSILGRSMSGRLMTERSMPRGLMPRGLMNERPMPMRSTAENQWMQINSRRSVLDRSMLNRSMADRSMTDRSMTDRSMTDRSMADRSMADRSMPRRPMPRRPMPGSLLMRSIPNERISEAPTLRRPAPFERVPMVFGEPPACHSDSEYDPDKEQILIPNDPFQTPYSQLSTNKLVLSIPDAHIGYIIGRGGSIIREIRQKSQTKIQISDKAGSEERKVILCGPQQANKYALHLINEQLIFRGAITSPLKPINVNVL